MNTLSSDNLKKLREVIGKHWTAAQVINSTGMGTFFNITKDGNFTDIDHVKGPCHHFISSTHYNQDWFMNTSRKGYKVDKKYHKYVDLWYEYLSTFFKGHVIPFDKETYTSGISRNLPGNVVLWWLQCHRLPWEYSNSIPKFAEYIDEGYNPYVAMMMANCLTIHVGRDIVRDAGSVHNPLYLSYTQPKVLERFLEVKEIIPEMDVVKRSPKQGERHGVNHLFRDKTRPNIESPLAKLCGLAGVKAKPIVVMASVFEFKTVKEEDKQLSTKDRFIQTLDFKKEVLFA